MTPSARLAAAIEVLADIEARRRPVTDALKDWGLSHRFAGSKDRAAIAGLVYEALRRKASAAWIMGEGTARAILLGTLRLQREMSAETIAALCSGERFAPEPLSDDERERLAFASLDGAPASAAGDFPDWIEPSLTRAFGPDLLPELQALARRAPIDLRANLLRTDRSRLRADLAHFDLAETPRSPQGLRLWPGADERGPALQSEPEFLKGHFEIQDEGSQLAALLSAARPGEQVVDLCAGGGGKTLALAAMMGNQGQIYATDSDPRRLAPIHDRLARAGARNVQVRTPRGRQDAVTDLDGRMDLVLVDAPCTGSGTWRRNPDAKWRLRPGSLETRRRDQEAVLDRAARLVRPGGRIVYVTCSILPEENEDAVAAFLERNHSFGPGILDAAGALLGVPDAPAMVRLTPHRHGTDGFYVAALKRVDD